MSAHGVGPLLLHTAARLVDGCHSRFLLGRGRTRPLRLLTSPYLPPIQRPLYSRLCRPRLRPCDRGSRAWGLRVVLNDSVVSSIACVSQSGEEGHQAGADASPGFSVNTVVLALAVSATPPSTAIEALVLGGPERLRVVLSSSSSSESAYGCSCSGLRHERH